MEKFIAPLSDGLRVMNAYQDLLFRKKENKAQPYKAKRLQSAFPALSKVHNKLKAMMSSIQKTTSTIFTIVSIFANAPIKNKGAAIKKAIKAVTKLIVTLRKLREVASASKAKLLRFAR